MQRIGAWVGGELLASGEAVVLFGAAGEPGTRVTPTRGNADERDNGPAHLGTRGAERRSEIVYTREVATGLHSYAIYAHDRETGELAATPGATGAIYINTAPRLPRLMRPEAALVAGRMRFHFGRGL